MKAPKPKTINFEIIHPNDGKHEPEPYRILREIRDAHHSDIAPARIASETSAHIFATSSGVAARVVAASAPMTKIRTMLCGT